MATLVTPRIYPCLMFHTHAEQAAQYYCSLIPNSSIESVSRYTGESSQMAGMPEGTAMVVMFRLDGQLIMGLNGGPSNPMNQAVSLVLTCGTQTELDHYWQALLADGGRPLQCGWLVDRFGLSWQIVPEGLMELVSGGDSAVAQRVLQQVWQMTKLDIAALEAAAGGKLAY